ncbi:hypothetical protein [Amorphus orientalis]|uniref:Uncharacterized protein n=1 Tax=Amorphus orientalis TaxID=649198 RepID=A0AAE3VMZ9_9HYPH|nr:hypothetical protein [Amorphus orientalis]MDQ0314725.1 hypothetical protein [Amorphus orientalis]
MFVAVLVRRLRPGATFEAFKQAWLAEEGHFGRPVRVTHARRIDEPREIVSYARMDVTRDELDLWLQRTAAAEATRHDRIAELIEATVVAGIYEEIDETELS